MITLQDLYDHLGIDEVDAMITRKATRALNAGQHYLYGAVGEDVYTLLPDDPRADEIALRAAAEYYDTRELSAKVANTLHRLMAVTELQLQLELRTLREAGEADGV